MEHYLLYRHSDESVVATGSSMVELMARQNKFNLSIVANEGVWSVCLTSLSDGYKFNRDYTRYDEEAAYPDMNGWKSEEILAEVCKDMLQILCRHYDYSLYKEIRA